MLGIPRIEILFTFATGRYRVASGAIDLHGLGARQCSGHNGERGQGENFAEMHFGGRKERCLRIKARKTEFVASR